MHNLDLRKRRNLDFFGQGEGVAKLCIAGAKFVGEVSQRMPPPGSDTVGWARDREDAEFSRSGVGTSAR